jgi:hypothetical protein
MRQEINRRCRILLTLQQSLKTSLRQPTFLIPDSPETLRNISNWMSCRLGFVRSSPSLQAGGPAIKDRFSAYQLQPSRCGCWSLQRPQDAPCPEDTQIQYGVYTGKVNQLETWGSHRGRDYVSCDMTPCPVSNSYRRLGGRFCLYIQAFWPDVIPNEKIWRRA